MHASKPAVTALIAVLLAGAAFLGSQYSDAVLTFFDPRGLDALDDSTVRLYASIFGDQTMYEHFVSAIDAKNTLNGHTMMHQIGDALYDRHGIGGLQFCGSDFHSGCMHQVIGREMAVEGANSFDELSKKCDTVLPEDTDACAHGIGHGLTFVNEYVADEIPTDLDRCVVIHKKDATISPGQSCYTGVFMEYNMHFMQSKDGIPRHFNASDPIAPCNSLLDPFFRNMCMYWIPPWIDAISPVKGLPTDRYAAMGQICDSVTDRDMHMWCVLGIGRDIGIALPPPKTAFMRCDTATSNDTDLHACAGRAAVQYRFYKLPADSDTLCSLLGVGPNDPCRSGKGRIPNPKQ
jgi:hypothetical protein